MSPISICAFFTQMSERLIANYLKVIVYYDCEAVIVHDSSTSSWKLFAQRKGISSPLTVLNRKEYENSKLLTNNRRFLAPSHETAQYVDGGGEMDWKDRIGQGPELSEERREVGLKVRIYCTVIGRRTIEMEQPSKHITWQCNDTPPGENLSIAQKLTDFSFLNYSF